MVGSRIFGLRSQRGFISAVVGTVRLGTAHHLHLHVLFEACARPFSIFGHHREPTSPGAACSLLMSRRVFPPLLAGGQLGGFILDSAGVQRVRHHALLRLVLQGFPTQPLSWTYMHTQALALFERVLVCAAARDQSSHQHETCLSPPHPLLCTVFSPAAAPFCDLCRAQFWRGAYVCLCFSARKSNSRDSARLHFYRRRRESPRAAGRSCAASSSIHGLP